MAAKRSGQALAEALSRMEYAILDAGDLAGFRNRLVFIRGSNHVPPPYKSFVRLVSLS